MTVQAGFSTPGRLSAERPVGLEPRLRALVEIRTAQLGGTLAGLARHARRAIELGETQRRVAAVGRWRDSPLFSERERVALALADALARPDGRRAAASARARAAAAFGPDELVQLVLACATATAPECG